MVEIECENLYFADDLTYISGITDVTYGLVSNQPIYLCENGSTEYKEYKVEVKDIIRQGHINYADTIFYIVDNLVKIDGIVYNVDLMKSKLTLRNGMSLDIVTDGYPIQKTSFVVRKDLDYELAVDYVSCTKEFKYIYSGVTKEKLYLCTKYNNTDTPLYYLSGTTMTDNGIEILNIDCEIKQSIDSVFVGDKEFKLQSEWKNTTYGDFCHIYLANNKVLQCGDIIKVSPLSPIEEWVGIDENNMLTYKGKTYTVSETTKDYLEYNGNELLIKYTKDNWSNGIQDNKISSFGYAQLDGTPILLHNITRDGAIRKEDGKSFTIKQYQYVTIGDKDYKITTKTTPRFDLEEVVERGITIVNNEPIRLAVVDVVSNSQLRCTLVDTDVMDNGILYLMSNNTNLLKFELENKLFNAAEFDDVNMGYNDEYKLYKPTDYIVIPMNFSNTIANNMHQNYVLESEFFSKETSNSINRIIDMEKNIYFPARKHDNDTFVLIDELVFDLHFRSRDLNSWSINEDYIGQSSKIKCNWNIFDYYHHDTTKTDEFKPSIKLKNYSDGYYQPSDLLYFLGFNDNDIFYQKQKVAKSFLRISFYDSPNPLKQNLLHTATIFMDEGRLYKTYIESIQNKSTYVGVNEISRLAERVYTDYISVKNDTYDQRTKLVTCEANKRLAASFSVKNMLESAESSEGFYLYLFREFNEGLHEKEIYMTVEFNHAGYGRTIKFMQPHNIDNKGNYRMVNFADNNDKEAFMKGISLNKIYDYLYIPIKVKYDFDNKKYLYYLPDWLTKYNDQEGIMRFNLYELKIADESIKQD